jgi:hypothetical protein
MLKLCNDGCILIPRDSRLGRPREPFLLCPWEIPDGQEKMLVICRMSQTKGTKVRMLAFLFLSTHIFFSYSAATGSEFLLRKPTPTEQKRKMPLLKGRRMQISIFWTETLAELENPDTVGSTEGVGRREVHLSRRLNERASVTRSGVK